MTVTTFDIEAIEAAGGPILTIPSGRVIYLRGDKGECAYIVKSGTVEIRAAGHPVEPIAPGEVFGETALIDHESRTSTAVALTDVELVEICRPIFGVLIRDDSDFALAILGLMARRLRALADFHASPAELDTLGTMKRPVPIRAVVG